LHWASGEPLTVLKAMVIFPEKSTTTAHRRLKELRKAGFIDQVQGCMWITGRKWWHFGLYCPALASIGKDFYCRHVDRDDNYIEALEADLVEFHRLVSAFKAKLLAVQPNFELERLAA